MIGRFQKITPALGAGRVALAIAAMLLSTAAQAQSNAVHRLVLQDQPFPSPIYHSVTVKTSVDQGGTVLPHTHPGVEMSYLLEGRGILKVAGQPDRTLSAGESFSIPAATVHSFSNTGQGVVTILTTYVVEKDKPLATPVP